jgi:hypothetical protein
MAVFDLHGDMQDPAAVNAALQFASEWRPSIRVIGGDTWDFSALRRKASDEERRKGLKADFEAGMSFVKSFRPTDLLLGNHCKRLWDAAAIKDGPASDYYRELVGKVETYCVDRGCNLKPYHKRHGIARIGSKLKVLHGYYTGVSACRKHAMVYGDCLFGHVHAFDSATVAGLEGRTARSIGCLSRLDFDYDSSMPDSMRHAQGWAYGLVFDDGSYQVMATEGVNGKFAVATDMRVIAA